MPQIQGFEFFPLKFDRDGRLERPEQLGALTQHASNATDVVFLAHGFRNNEEDATVWYQEFLRNFRSHIARQEFQGKLDNRKWAVAAVYWPSKAVPEGPSREEGEAKSLAGDHEAQREYIRAQLRELRADVRDEAKSCVDEAIALLDQIDDDTDKQNEFVDKLLAAVESQSIDENEGLDFVRSMEGSKVLERLSTRSRRRRVDADDDGEEGGGASSLSAGPSDDDEEGAAQGLGSFFGGVLGRVGQLVNLTTWYIMKERSGVVGFNGVAQAVRDLKGANPQVKIHLVGHSLGGRLMAACAKSLAQDLAVRPDSMTLLQAAFSHYGFSKARHPRGEGFFRSVVERKVVKGPFVATFSSMDDVVGRVYAVASMLRGDNVKKFGDKDSQFGGIGANGAQQFETGEVLSEVLHKAGTPYPNLKPGVLLCLDGSGNLITSHGDITNENVTYAFTSAVALT
ncbi:MAG TPA: hypothetical protein VEQ63_16270 [Bryobacteraceae bacterium]|nr:hypothetical protein [Bryobacteraceae bacterium]